MTLALLPPWQSDLATFTTLTRLDRRARVRELSSLVAGARILNWDLRGGGGVEAASPTAWASALEDLPTALAEAARTAAAETEAAVRHAADKIRR